MSSAGARASSKRLTCARSSTGRSSRRLGAETLHGRSGHGRADLLTESFATASHVTPCALSLLALVVFSSVPLVILRARVEDGHLVVSGRRWPGRQTTLSCALADATRFEEQTFQKALVPGAPSKVLYYRRVALRTRDDRVLGLTHAAYPSARWPHSSVVARLNAWLATQTDDCG